MRFEINNSMQGAKLKNKAGHGGDPYTTKFVTPRLVIQLQNPHITVLF